LVLAACSGKDKKSSPGGNGNVCEKAAHVMKKGLQEYCEKSSACQVACECLMQNQLPTGSGCIPENDKEEKCEGRAEKTAQHCLENPTLCGRCGALLAKGLCEESNAQLEQEAAQCKIF